MTGSPEAAPLIRHGTPEFRRITLAFFVAGFATFALLYCVQPLMPVFAETFHVSAAASSLSLSLTTGLLAPAMMVAGAISERRGRKNIMAVSLGASSLLMLVAAFATRWDVLLAARALAGITFAGLPAVSVAYLSEELDSQSIGLAAGLMIGGNGIGGMTGRLLTSLVAEGDGWRWVLAAMAVFGIAATFVFWRMLPAERHFRPRVVPPHVLVRTYIEQLRDVRLVPLFAQGFLLMGTFVTAYNYVTYHLLGAPYFLSHAVVGAIFVVYPLGIFASAGAGALAHRVGRGRMLTSMIGLMLVGVLLMIAPPVMSVVAGIAVLTVGFFGAHSVATTWVGVRATHGRAQASALYFFFYYIGSSVAGSMGGVFWERWGWIGVIGFLVGMIAVALGALAALPRVEG